MTVPFLTTTTTIIVVIDNENLKMLILLGRAFIRKNISIKEQINNTDLISF